METLTRSSKELAENPIDKKKCDIFIKSESIAQYQYLNESSNNNFVRKHLSVRWKLSMHREKHCSMTFKYESSWIHNSF